MAQIHFSKLLASLEKKVLMRQFKSYNLHKYRVEEINYNIKWGLEFPSIEGMELNSIFPRWENEKLPQILELSKYLGKKFNMPFLVKKLAIKEGIIKNSSYHTTGQGQVSSFSGEGYITIHNVGVYKVEGFRSSGTPWSAMNGGIKVEKQVLEEKGGKLFLNNKEIDLEKIKKNGKFNLSATPLDTLYQVIREAYEGTDYFMPIAKAIKE